MSIIVPLIVVSFILLGILKKVPVFDTFCIGVKEGLKTIYKISPTLIGLVTAVTMLRESGAVDRLSELIAPIAHKIGIPPEIVPLAILRPVSGGGSTALLIDVFKTYGPDSEIGRIASVLAGSTETTLYVITLYYGSIRIKKIRHTLIAGLMADLTAVVFAVLTVNILLS